MHTLVVYFSRKGHVRRVAQEWARKAGADLYEIKTPERTRGWLGFWWCGRFGMHRWPMPIEPIAVDVASYDKVIVCSPIWVFTVCAPIRSFLEQSAGRIRAVEYGLVHFSAPMEYSRTVARMNQLLGISHDRVVSIACPWGRFWNYSVQEAASV